MKITVYVIERGGEYYGLNGFWALNVYTPHFYNNLKDAENDFKDIARIAREDAKILPLEIETRNM